MSCPRVGSRSAVEVRLPWKPRVPALLGRLSPNGIHPSAFRFNWDVAECCADFAGMAMQSAMGWIGVLAVMPEHENRDLRCAERLRKTERPVASVPSVMFGDVGDEVGSPRQRLCGRAAVCCPCRAPVRSTAANLTRRFLAEAGNERRSEALDKALVGTQREGTHQLFVLERY